MIISYLILALYSHIQTIAHLHLADGCVRGVVGVKRWRPVLCYAAWIEWVYRENLLIRH